MKSPESYPEHIFTSLNELLSMSRHARLFRFSGKKKKINRILGGSHPSRLRGRGLDFEEVRDYVKGDDIRHIDWKVTARTRETHTRVYTEEKERPVLIVVDQSKSMFFGSVKRMKSVVAAELAAIAAFRVLKKGDRVGGVVFADNGTDYILPKRNRKNILRFLDQIVKRNHELAESDEVDFKTALPDVINRVANIVTHDYLLIIISDFHRYSEEVVKSIVILSQHNDILLAKVADPMEQELPQTDFVAGDTTYQITIRGKSGEVRKKYSDHYASSLEKFESRMQKHRIPVFTFNTQDPVEDQLKNLFKVT